MNSERLLHFINDYYITERKKYVLQLKGGEYITVGQSLGDHVIKKHLSHEKTAGIFAGKHLSKFICFDIDQNKNSLQTARELANLLEEEYNITREQMLITFSGNKGYHFELFFTTPLSLRLLKKFYLKVISDLNKSESQIEFRPNNGQAVKIPFGIHTKTGFYCFPISPLTFEPAKAENALQVAKIDAERFVDLLTEIEFEKIDTLITETHKKGPISAVNLKSDTNIKSEVLTVLNAHILQEPGTRNRMTFNISLFLKSTGYPKAEIQEKLFSIMKNTYQNKREFFSNESDFDFICSEIIRITDFVFKKDYVLKNNRIEKVVFYSYELAPVLQLRKEQQKMAVALLYHSKSVNAGENVFYMTYQQMSELGNTQNRKRLFNFIEDLAEVGFLEVVERGVVNAVKLDRENVFQYLPNRYRIPEKQKVKGIRNKKISLGESDILEKDLDRLLVDLFSEKELKNNITKNQFYKRFQCYYT